VAKKNSTLKIYRLLLTLTYMLTIIVGSMMNLKNSSKFKFVNLDKAIHFLVYSVFCLLVFDTIKQYNFKEELKIAILFTIAFGIVIEFFQYLFTINRKFELLDIFANILGIITMAVIINLSKKNKK